MNIKWNKIKNVIFEKKLSEIDNVLTEVKSGFLEVSRTDWVKPIESWTAKQIKTDSLKLNLQEYAKLKLLTDNLANSFFTSLDNETQLLKYGNELKSTYKQIITNKEEDLKIEVVVDILQETNLPLDLISEWYVANKDLSNVEFNEALGEFLGDVWSGMKHGAGVGALAGAGAGSLGGLPSTFAGTGIGGLIGGATGGIYGGGKHLLKKIWDYRKNQLDFNHTKEEALKVLKKLKNQSTRFNMDYNFRNLLDQIIDKLGTAKAHKIYSPPVQKVEPSPVEKPIPPKPEVTMSPPEPPKPEVTMSPPEPEKPSEPQLTAFPDEEPEIVKPKKKVKSKPIPKLGKFKSLHDIMRYYDSHPEQIPVLGHLLDARGWGNANVEDISFEDLNDALKDTEHLHEPAYADTFQDYKDIGKNYIDDLKRKFSLTEPLTKAPIEHIVNKYIDMLREQIY